MPVLQISALHFVHIPYFSLVVVKSEGTGQATDTNTTKARNCLDDSKLGSITGRIPNRTSVSSSDFPPGSASTALVAPWWTEGPTRLSDKGGDCVRYLCATWPLSAQKCFCIDIKHRYTPELNFDKCGPIHFNQNDQPIWQNTGHCTEEKEWLQPSTFSLIQNLVASFFLCSF